MPGRSLISADGAVFLWQGSASFLEKRSKKLLICLLPCWRKHKWQKIQKSFLVLFSKKEPLA
jgi:hypothetical protein